MKNLLLILAFLFVGSMAYGQALIDKVPVDVMNEFNAKLSFDEAGKVNGAYVEKVAEYASIGEVISYLQGNYSLASGDAYQNYKPKGRRGCKVKLGWLCFAPDAPDDLLGGNL